MADFLIALKFYNDWKAFKLRNNLKSIYKRKSKYKVVYNSYRNNEKKKKNIIRDYGGVLYDGNKKWSDTEIGLIYWS